MYRYRHNYWSTSTFARWLTKRALNVYPPEAETMEGWHSWRKQFQINAPVTYFVVDTLLDRLQDIVLRPHDVYRHARHYLENRFGDVTHYLRTGTKLGGWDGVDERLLHGCFNALVDFVEIEKAHMDKVFGEGTGSFYRLNPLNPLQSWRSPEAGLRYLNWEMSLKEGRKLTPQARDAAEIKKLYTWWTVARPNRVDPYAGIDISWGRELTPNQREQLSAAGDLETSYYDEDTKMLVRLMKIRRSLWT